MTTKHVDVLIVGAGVSGVGAACHLTRDCPRKSYLILERRNTIGGTWDLFRYPGVRSDSDMFTFGYNFRPWTDSTVLADGDRIRNYVEATVDEYHVREHISFGRKVISASWSSATNVWTITAMIEATGETETYTASFLMGCTGYYNYDTGYRPDFPGQASFRGQIVHPQHWPADLDYAGKKVVVIGSGATAVTLVPAMAGTAAHVTMLQRSPTYIVSLPALDKISMAMRKVMPEMWVYRLSRARNIGLQRLMYNFARSFPNAMRRLVLSSARRQLSPDFDLRHFTPSYDPWDQRLCVVPDGDLFRVLSDGTASIVTDHIDTFTETGIRLQSGEELDADIIVTATGLEIQMLGGTHVDIDGAPLVLNDVLTYKSVMIENVPNAAMIFGYTNASWTLKADIASEFACRVINHMDANGYRKVVPRAKPEDRGQDSVLGSLQSGYVMRGRAAMPRQGTRAPWIVLNNYLRDAPTLRRTKLEDGLLEFSRSRPTLVKDEAAISA